jgi:RNA polymerase sigma-70 factor (ECF subfamily)
MSDNLEKIEDLRNIVDGCNRNDRRAQEQLFKMYYGKMLAVCRRYMNDNDSAQEVLQEGFIKVFDKIGGFDFKGSLEGWIRRIVANTAIDAIRKAKRNPFQTDKDTDFKQDATVEMIDQEEWDLLELKADAAMEAIQQLSPAYRTVFNLYVIEDYTHKEIADLLGINEGTSKSNLAKAKMNLQKILKKKYSSHF